MPSPTYLLSHKCVLENVAVGNEIASECVRLTFAAIDPKTFGTENRPILTLEGGIHIDFYGKPVSKQTAEQCAEGFELGKLYRLVPVEE